MSIPTTGPPTGPTAREPLEAILLVGGQGTRLRPLTIGTPKPLLPTAGVPFLAHLLARAAAAGVTRAVLATAYRAEAFPELLGDGSAFGLEIAYVYEEVPLDTGGGIRNAAAGLHGGPDDPVLVFNTDILSGHDIGAQLDLHEKADAAVTLPTDPGGRVTAFLEKTPDPVTSQINAGCYVFRRRVIDAMPAGQRVSVERETFPGLISSGEVVMGYVDTGYWLDVGTPEAFVRGSCDLVLGRLTSPAIPASAGLPAEALLLDGADVRPGAEVSGGTVVGAGAVIHPGARVTGSVLFDEASVAAGACSSTRAWYRYGAVVTADPMNSAASGGSLGANRPVADGSLIRSTRNVRQSSRPASNAIRYHR